jgi:hypothetical protein
MKTFITAPIAVFLSICLNGLQAQTTQVKLNQVELIKQYISNWKGEVGKDTTAFWDIKLNGTVLECNFKYVTKDKIVMEGKQLWEYDKKVDKFILSSITNGMDTGTSVLWFTSKNKSIIIPFSDISNPEKATFRLEMEFKSPVIFIQKTIVNNNLVKTFTFDRVKN